MFFINPELNTTDKFDMCKFMDMSNDGVFDCLTSYFLYMLPKIPYTGYIIANNKHENRPDMLSYSIYGGTQYWWILMLYNNLLSPTDIKVGTKIYYPSMDALEQLYTQANLSQKMDTTV